MYTVAVFVFYNIYCSLMCTLFSYYSICVYNRKLGIFDEFKGSIHKRLKRLGSKLEKTGQNYDPSSPSISSSSEHIDDSSNDNTNNTTNTTDSGNIILNCEQMTSDLLIYELYHSNTSSIYITTLIDKWSELCLMSETSNFSTFGHFITVILDVQYKLNIANNHNISINLINSILLKLFIPYKQPRNLTHVIDDEYTLSYYYVNLFDFLVSVHNKTDFPVSFLSTRDVYDAIPMSTVALEGTVRTPGIGGTEGYVSSSNMRDLFDKLEGFEFVLVPPFRRGDVWMDLPSLFKLPNVSLILGLRCPGCYLPSPSTTSGTTDDGTNGSLSAQESGYIHLTRHGQQLWLKALTDLSLLLGEHGISLSAESGSGSGSHKLEAAVMLTAAYFIDPTYDKLRNMGISWHSVKAIDFGHYISSYSVYLQRISSSSSSTCSYVSKVSSKPRVVIYCEEYGNAYWPRWGPSSVNTTGLGGSEEAAYYVSLELAALGYDVEVYADPPDADIYHSNSDTDSDNSSTDSNSDNSSGIEVQSGLQGSVKWLHYSCYNPLSKADVFIAWRYSMSVLLGQHCRKRFLWLHDLVGSDLLPMYLTPMVSSHSVYTFFHIHMYTH